MSGVTKHIFNHEIKDILLMWNTQLQRIACVLPVHYGERDIIVLLKKYYPYEWNYVEYKFWYYQKKDRFLLQRKGKARYNMLPTEKLLKRVPFYQTLMSDAHRKKYKEGYMAEICRQNGEKLWKERKPYIERVDKKIKKAKAKTQQVTPPYLDKLIGLYNRKGTSQKDKVYILADLKKYYNYDIINFFFKLNDTEINMQLRDEAFYHLQSLNFRPRKRRQKFMHLHTHNKKKKEYLKKVYAYEKFIIPFCPEELEYRIENGKEQKIKEFDYFISHSSKDFNIVQKLIEVENRIGKTIFCDWINDDDYLKRHLACEATLKVIEKRLKQSKAVIFVLSENSVDSIWCKYELNYFAELKRPIYVINKNDIEKGIYILKTDNLQWIMDASYKQITLFEGRTVETILPN